MRQLIPPWVGVALSLLLTFFWCTSVQAETTWEDKKRARVLSLHQELIRLKNMRDQSLEWAQHEFRKSERLRELIDQLERERKSADPVRSKEIGGELRELRINRTLAVHEADQAEKNAVFFDNWRKDWVSFFRKQVSEFSDLEHTLEDVDTPPPPSVPLSKPESSLPPAHQPAAFIFFFSRGTSYAPPEDACQ